MGSGAEEDLGLRGTGFRDGRERAARGESSWRRSSWRDRKKIKSAGHRTEKRGPLSGRLKLSKVVAMWSKRQDEKDPLG